MNLETKITIYKFTPQLFTLTRFSRIRKHVCTRIFPYSYTYVQTCADVCMYNYMSKIKFHIKDKGVF